MTAAQASRRVRRHEKQEEKKIFKHFLTPPTASK
jgi:hypothetical protein